METKGWQIGRIIQRGEIEGEVDCSRENITTRQSNATRNGDRNEIDFERASLPPIRPRRLGNEAVRRFPPTACREITCHASRNFTSCHRRDNIADFRDARDSIDDVTPPL